jgi:protein involved in polysaccharide export with SLBB domain
MTRLKLFVVSVAVAATIGLVLSPDAFAQQAAPKPAAAPKLPSAAPSDYVIGPEDVLQISVWKNETLSRVVPVRPDGKISLPLLHDVQAAGLTAMQLRDKISRALGEFMPNPEVSPTCAASGSP